MSFYIGGWAIPLLISVAAWVWSSHSAGKNRSHGGDYAAIGDAVTAIVYTGRAIIITLVAWLGYFMALVFSVPH